MFAWLPACAPDLPFSPPPPRPGGVLTVVSAAANVGPARELQLELPEAAPLHVELSGGDDQRMFEAPASDRHALPLVGLLPDERYQVFVQAGAETWDLELETEPLPAEALPTFEVLVADPDRAEPGWTLVAFDLTRAGAPSGVVLLDERQRIRWWWLDEEGRVEDDLVIAPDGKLWRRRRLELAVADWLGRVERRYVAADSPAVGEPGVYVLGSGPDHHDTVPLADGTFWAMGFASVEGEVPVAYGATETRPATVQDTPVYHLDAEGGVLARFSMVDLLDPAHAGWGALAEEPSGLDVAHANALEVFPGDGLLVTLRNQDVALRLEEDGTVRWRLGDPAGWDPALAGEFLAPVGEPDWAYHGHGADLLPDGTFVVFDNHNGGGTPYGPAGPQLSRAYVARVDEAARTVEVLATDGETAVGPMYSYIVGDADLLPETGHVLAVWGAVREEAGVSNLDRGLGRHSAHVVELDPERPGEPVLDVRISAPAEVAAEGVYVYRAERIPQPWGGSTLDPSG